MSQKEVDQSEVKYDDITGGKVDCALLSTDEVPAKGQTCVKLLKVSRFSGSDVQMGENEREAERSAAAVC